MSHSLPQFSLKWDSYTGSVFRGLSALQQNGEFVDMTLAADGHFVKVHQLLIVLASPYLKELIQSAQCQHPIIFLNNVCYDMLCSLLEYIYTGEVVIPSDKINVFFDIAKALHICGLENMDTKAISDVDLKENNTISILQEEINNHHSPQVTEFTKNMKRVSPINLSEPAEKKSCDISRKIITDKGNSIEQLDDNFLDNFDLDDQEDDAEEKSDNNSEDIVMEKNQKTSTELQYTVSNRGSLQLILNRFMYNMHHKAHKGRVRRWRCVDYRMRGCKAYVDTDEELVVSRMHIHNHSFHDTKIIKKITNKSVYSAIAQALDSVGEQASKKQEDQDV